MNPEPDTSPASTRQTSRPVGRTIIGDGREWRVREVPLPAYDRRGTKCLIFETADAMRRVRNYPTDWADWPDDELYLLSLRT